MKIKRGFFAIFLAAAWAPLVYAKSPVVNVYTWAEEIPYKIIQQFEKETGIKVNYATFDSNEIMYAKLRTSSQNSYDVVEPSNYYIQRLARKNMLEKLDHNKLTSLHNLDPFFATQPDDVTGNYGVPFLWGATGLFYNQNYFDSQKIVQWNDLLAKQFVHQLMLLDDSRELFAVALRMLGYSGNDSDPQHIEQAYLKLKELLANVKVFSNDAVLSILIDEDAAAGVVWNADLYKAHQENPNLQFVFPRDGFTIWVDTLAILKNAPHRENAYKFINFLLRPDIAKAISLEINYATTNRAAKNLMPDAVKFNPVLYPSADILRHGEIQMDIGENAFAMIEKYWEKLKMEA